jgi:hypothetical protein
MNDLQRVTFRFDRETEVHYLARTPEVGDRVSHENELWLVTLVESDPLGLLVICEQSRDEALRAGAIELAPTAEPRGNALNHRPV